MTPLCLTDDELNAVFVAARPIAVDRRDAFLQQVADELRRCNGNHGPGDVHRAVRVAQKAHFDPPLATEVGRPSGLGKYR